MLAGVNCRDLRDLDVRFERFAELAPHLPRHLPTVAESGIGSVADVEAVARAGYRLALVGSSLMRAADPAAALADWLAAGRAAVARRHCTMFVKICGMNSPEAVEAAVAAGADALGFVFAESPRAGDAGAGESAVRRRAGARHARRRHASPAQGALGARHRDLRAELAANRRRGLPLDQAAAELHARCPSIATATRLPTRDLPDRLLFEGTHSGSGRVADWDEASGLARVAEVILAGGLDRR